MDIASAWQAHLANGITLATTRGDAAFTTYVVVAPPDLEILPTLLPPPEFEQEGEIHVASVDQPEDATLDIPEILDIAHDGDTVVFLCADEACWAATVQALGYTGTGAPDKPN